MQASLWILRDLARFVRYSLIPALPTVHERMKNLLTYRILTSIILLMLMTFTCAGQEVIVDNIERAIKAGDANGLADYFSSSITITINNKEDAYSDKQGLQVLRAFFTRNQVRDFSIKRVGNQTSANGFYAIGIMNTNSGEYKVYLYIKHLNNQSYLQQIKMTK